MNTLSVICPHCGQQFLIPTTTPSNLPSNPTCSPGTLGPVLINEHAAPFEINQLPQYPHPLPSASDIPKNNFKPTT